MALIYTFLIVIAIVYPLARGAISVGGNRDGRLAGTDNTGAKVLVFIIFLVFFFYAGFRGISAAVNDEWVYRNRVLSMASKPLTYIFEDSNEVLDNLGYWIVSHLLPGESQWMLAYYAMITYGCFIYAMYKQCDNFDLAILLLFLLNMVNVSFNTMQQMEAVSVTMLGIPFVHKKQFLKYAIVVLIAALIHSSAIVLIAVYFIANMKPWSGKFIAVAAGFVVIMLLFNTVMPGLFSRMEILEDYEGSYGNGVKIITVLVAFVPLIFSFIFRSYFPSDDNAFNCSVNMSLVYAMIYLVSTQNLYVARFAMYLQPYIILLYTRGITYLRKENLSGVTLFCLIAGYGLTMVYFVQNISYKILWVI